MLVSCSQKGCEEPAAFAYDWPGQETPGRACVKHSQTVERTAQALGFRVTLHPLSEPVRKPYEAPKATAHGRLERYDLRGLSFDGELNRLELLALQEHLDAHGQFHGPAFRQWALMRIERCKKLLDIELRGKLAAAGLPSDPEWMREPGDCDDLSPGLVAAARLCACVNSVPLAIGETTCPRCGGELR